MDEKSKSFEIWIRRKVFRDFEKTNSMKNGSIIGIVGGIVITIAIIGVAFTFNQETDIIKVEDAFDKEIEPVEVPEIQEKLDDIKKITDENEYKNLERDWPTSGPFQIDRSEYAIGEKIFIRIGGLELDMLGQIVVMRPLNATHHKMYLTIPFDGSDKSAFNYYLEPQINTKRAICSIDDLTGEWFLVFRGTDYPNITFKINDKVVPGTDVTSVC